MMEWPVVPAPGSHLSWDQTQTLPASQRPFLPQSWQRVVSLACLGSLCGDRTFHLNSFTMNYPPVHCGTHLLEVGRGHVCEFLWPIKCGQKRQLCDTPGTKHAVVGVRLSRALFAQELCLPDSKDDGAFPSMDGCPAASETVVPAETSSTWERKNSPRWQPCLLLQPDLSCPDDYE